MKQAKGINKKGVTPPQQGRIVRANSSPAVVTAGQAPQIDKGGAPQMKTQRSGAAPTDPRLGPKSNGNAPEANVRKGTDPRPNVPAIFKGLPDNVKAGAAPTGGNSPAGAGKSQADVDNQRAQAGRNGYKKGGKVMPDQYAKGGQVISRNSPVGEVKAGNGGIAGVASNIPVAQPGGTPSTGIVASGVLPPQAGEMRGSPMKRMGAAPSLPRPKR